MIEKILHQWKWAAARRQSRGGFEVEPITRLRWIRKRITEPIALIGPMQASKGIGFMRSLMRMFTAPTVAWKKEPWGSEPTTVAPAWCAVQMPPLSPMWRMRRNTCSTVSAMFFSALARSMASSSETTPRRIGK